MGKRMLTLTGALVVVVGIVFAIAGRGTAPSPEDGRPVQISPSDGDPVLDIRSRDQNPEQDAEETFVEVTESHPDENPRVAEELVRSEVDRLISCNPIEDVKLRNRVRRSTIIGVTKYRENLKLSADQTLLAAELVFRKRLGDFSDSIRLPHEIKRVKAKYKDSIPPKALEEAENEFDVYRQYDPDLDRMLRGMSGRYESFARSFREILTDEQRALLDKSGSLVIR